MSSVVVVVGRGRGGLGEEREDSRQKAVLGSLAQVLTQTSV